MYSFYKGYIRNTSSDFFKKLKIKLIRTVTELKATVYVIHIIGFCFLFYFQFVVLM